jgi:isopenicillin N synthase-like dioxygenase
MADTHHASPADPTPTLPVLDLRDFTAGDAARRAGFVDRLRDTAHRHGFFYLRGYAAHTGRREEDLADVVLAASRQFFALPAVAKEAVRMVHSPQFRGYTAAGEEITRGQRDWREQLDVGAERALLPQTPDSPGWTRLQGPNQWPAELPALKPTLLDWQDALTVTGRHLLRALALALGQSEDRFDAAFGDAPVQHLKIIHYPGRADGESDQGVGAHKDGGCLTLLLQGAQAGLQALEREVGEPHWIDVPPLRGTLVINIGEVLEIQTGGFLRAAVHRVVSPPQSADRQSVAFFLSPRLDVALDALTLPPALAAVARGIDRDPLNPLIAHTGRNLLKGRLRSHPDVAQRHHADLLAAAGIAPGAPASAYA